jgi:hypothetical protein
MMTKVFRRQARLAGFVLVTLACAVTATLWLNASSESNASPRETKRPTSALESYPGLRVVDSEKDEDAFDREDRARENLTKACMAKKGWKYTPVPSIRVGPNDPLPQPESENSNDRYVASLSAQDRSLYFVALTGVADPDLESGLTLGGCVGEVHTKVPGVFSLAAELGPELERMRRDIAADPGVSAAAAKWVGCMTEGGFAFVDRSSMLRAADLGDEMAKRAAAFDWGHCAAPLTEAVDAARVRQENAFVDRHRARLDAHAAAIASAEPVVRGNQ